MDFIGRAEVEIELLENYQLLMFSPYFTFTFPNKCRIPLTVFTHFLHAGAISKDVVFLIYNLHLSYTYKYTFHIQKYHSITDPSEDIVVMFTGPSRLIHKTRPAAAEIEYTADAADLKAASTLPRP